MEPSKKSEKMKNKTETARRQFNLTENESVIQDYSCALSHKAGRMYLTQNYVLWIPAVALVGTPTSIPFKVIQSVKKEKNAKVFDNSISIETSEPASYFFSSFIHRDETFNLIEYLMKHPAYYIDIEEDEDELTPQKPNFEDNVYGKNPFEDDHSPGVNKQAYANIKVDTQSSRNALKVAAETQELGLATLSELTLQAEQLDRIEHGVERIHHNIDQANRILSHSKDKNSKQVDTKDRAVLSDLQVVPNILRLSEDKFMLCDMEHRKAIPGSIWDYDKIDALVIRARHQHLDIRFSKDQRCRLCCSDIQQIVHEFVMRHPSVNVIFEPGTRHFIYGPKLAMAPKATKAIGSGFFRKQANFTATAFKDAPDDVKKKLQQQDQDLDEIENIVGNITKIATVMGEEIERQTEHIDHITNRVDSADARLHQTNKKLQQKLK